MQEPEGAKTLQATWLLHAHRTMPALRVGARQHRLTHSGPTDLHTMRAASNVAGQLSTDRARSCLIWSPIVFFGAIIAVGVPLLVVYVFVNSLPLTDRLSGLRTECSIGISGTAASLTVRGWAAGQACREIMTGRGQESGTTWYEKTEQLVPTVICEYTISGRRFIVRDDGALKIAGSAICAYLEKRSR
jgi:hypothetical protein